MNAGGFTIEEYGSGPDAEVHVYPGDPDDHQPSSDCWCNPFVDRTPDNKALINHNVDQYKPSHGPKR